MVMTDSRIEAFCEKIAEIEAEVISKRQTHETYEKLCGILEGVCLRRNGKSKNAILNCLFRHGASDTWSSREKEEYFIKIIRDEIYKTSEFKRYCRYFGDKSEEILDEVRSIANEWEVI